MPAAVFSFGEWLPDLADMGSTGLLVANNVLPDIDGYVPWVPYVPYSGGGSVGGPHTLPATATGLSAVLDPANGLTKFYAADVNGAMYFLGGPSGWLARGALATTPSSCQFAQYENLVFAANGLAGYHTILSASPFATLTPGGSVVAKVGQFIMLGNLVGASLTAQPFSVAWSAIDDPTNFPPVGSATAIATQSGQQDLNPELGTVHAITAGDQFALVFQRYGITRMTYVGGDTVFQVDEIEHGRGAAYRHSAVRASGLTYFLAEDGFYLTDGVGVKPVGFGKVDKTILANIPGVVFAAFDPGKKCINWGLSANGTALPTTMYSFNINTGAWSSADATLRALCQAPTDGLFNSVFFTSNYSNIQFAFSASNVLVSTALTTDNDYLVATLTTFDQELNPGGRAFVTGVKPNITQSRTATALTVQVGTRNDLLNAPTYTATTSPTTATGFADFRADAKYHRVSIGISGKFTKAVGIEYRAITTSDR